MDQMALSCLLLVAATLGYLVSGIGILRAMRIQGGVTPEWMRNLAFGGFILHVAGIFVEMFASDAIHFGFGMAVSAMLMIAVLITLVESCVHRVTGLTGLVLLVAAAGSVLPVVAPGEVYRSETWSLLFRVHLLAALSAYSFMSIAVIQAILLMRMDKQLKSPERATETGILVNMPNLLAMERILFRIVACGFVCLTFVLIIGSMATLQSHGVVFVLEHKTVMTWLAWVVFAILLVGRYGFGWRKKKALSWFWVGVSVLAVAYLVYRFVIETLLM